ncbi:formylglycine-generating enzyme family protein [Beggiatoa leptomitoformis]|uniref:SUMF1/EgtB/PvdO family nonheme iron enzyme n=1 Tax=Beggiatoa leptomitoformis TaxID=288004 RepID=A0A2N9YFB5_9GAMM|nr:SUMF1/EgtB/PvdO family nonheme iron enzyme [Beggiatoa leptomitoformis]AUI69172.1 SUMF1/EgtB/PvdO family nonheme iron enzyme [Beggiatoa leptomitoformis]QGX03752.1 SUMF1/EgtB/PvdO family nonheme iron enzyme [Beggiatoa leptomitoformis]
MFKQFDWVTIPAGVFWMGTDVATDTVAAQFAWAQQVEQPQHQVYLPDYRISRYPVTNAQWGVFLAQTDYTWADHDKLWLSGIPEGKEQHPVVWVTWQDAMAFCRWAGVSLPTDAEWEKAARGTDKRLYPWGNQAPDASLANFANQVGDTTAVTHYPAGKSPYGVFDMAGNTWEWISTVWGTDKDNPEFTLPYQVDDGRESLEDSQILRMVRAGGWKYDATLIRCAYRDWNKPQTRGSGLGFRVVMR